MIKLPDVTLVMVETKVHKLGKMAIEQCLKHIEPHDVHIYTDNHIDLHVPGAQHFPVPDWPEKLDWVRFCYCGTAAQTKTSHELFVEWDAGIFDPGMWHKIFLQFDYIGAPWPHRDRLNVGNGGFALRSQRLLECLAKNQDKFPIDRTDADAVLCRDHRPALEGEGYRWAGPDMAMNFAFENVKRDRSSRHFGFHELRNWPLVLPPDELEERLQVARENPYVVSTHKLLSLYSGLPHYITGTDSDGHWNLGVV